MSSLVKPQLLTDRLALRQWSADELSAVLRGPRKSHWAPDFPAEGDSVIAQVLTELDESAIVAHRQIVERDNGLVIGSIGLFLPPNDGAVELGYGIVPSRRGSGYATEATRALTDFAFTLAEVQTVHASVELSNPASVRVLEKAGFGHWSDDGVTAKFGVNK